MSLATRTSLTSVIVVSFYTGPVLFEAIDSVLKQSAEVELVLVNNGNPPEVVEQLRQRAAADPRVILLTGHGNVGFASANNLGVAEAHGSYILLLNPDCLMAPDAVARLQRHASELTSPFMLGARLLNEDGSDQRGCRRELLTPKSALIEALHLYRLFPSLTRLNRHEEAVPTSRVTIPVISGAFMYLSRVDFDRIGGFDAGYFLHVDDLDLCLRFRLEGGEIYFVPDVVVTHIGGTSGVSSNFVERHKALGFIRYFRLHFSKSTPRVLLWLLEGTVWARYYAGKVRRFGLRFV